MLHDSCVIGLVNFDRMSYLIGSVIFAANAASRPCEIVFGAHVVNPYIYLVKSLIYYMLSVHLGLSCDN